MRFAHLPLGEKFRYQGELYVKTAPLLASRVEGGQQRMIPRSADVETLTPPSASQPPTPATAAESAVVRFHQEAERLLETTAAGGSLDEAREALAEAREACLAALTGQASP